MAVGIGGSYLGPEFLYEALRADASCAKAAAGRTLKFVANVDPVDFARQTAGVDPETTLVVVVSKSFTTAETIMNAKTVKDWLLAGMSKAKAATVVRQHVAAVSTQMELTKAFGIAPENVFAFGDYVGGRFSVHSPVGVLPLALQRVRSRGCSFDESRRRRGRDVDGDGSRRRRGSRRGSIRGDGSSRRPRREYSA